METKLTKWTETAAEKHGVEIELERNLLEGDLLFDTLNKNTYILRLTVEACDEWLLTYALNPSGSYTFVSQAYWAWMEDLPGTIADEKQLRKLLPLLAQEMNDANKR